MISITPDTHTNSLRGWRVYARTNMRCWPPRLNAHAITPERSSSLSDQMRILFSHSRESRLNVNAIKPHHSRGCSFPVLLVPIFFLTQRGALTLGNASFLRCRPSWCRTLFPTHYMERYIGNDVLFERFVHRNMKGLLAGSRICFL